MGAVATLARTGAVTAQHLASVMGVDLIEVYAELAREEAAGRVRVNGGTRNGRTWEAMVPDYELPHALRGGALEVF